MAEGVSLEDGDPDLKALPKEALTKSLGRFLRYARFVNRIELTMHNSPSVRFMESFDAIVKHTETNTLFPNLLSFTMESYYNPGLRLDWAVELLSGSLLEIRYKPLLASCPPLPLKVALFWLESIALKCPNVQTLELHPYNPWVEWNESVPRDVHKADALIRGDFHKPLTRLTHLRRLYVSTYLTDRKDLTALSRLPNLETLDVCSGQQLDAMVIVPELPADSFPSLRHLALRNLHWEELHDIYKTPALVRSLHSLCLVVGPQPDPEEGPAEFQIIDNWLPIYVLNATFQQLNKLTLVFEILDRGQIVQLFESDLDALSSLPLEYIQVRGAIVEHDPDESTPCALLASLWPTVKEIHFWDQSATAADLVHFTALPHLRHLTLDLRIRPISADLTIPIIRQTVFRVLQCS
ncbi:hypothetical protein FRC09_004197 [Ceratobasidium sp. 395]|nr:hypothetical protein FRC09_004197 [Ceratobasidium sp. 395]